MKVWPSISCTLDESKVVCFQRTSSEVFLKKTVYQTIGHTAAKYSSCGLFGDHIRKVPPVPIPNTAVKLSEPMIVPTSVKVGIAEFLKTLASLRTSEGFFVCIFLSDVTFSAQSGCDRSPTGAIPTPLMNSS